MKDEKDSRNVPALLHTMAGKEVCATINVIKANNVGDGFIIYAEDIYDASMTTISNSESSPNPDFPSVDLTEVSFYILLLSYVAHHKLNLIISIMSFPQSLDTAETSKTPGSAKSVNKKIKTVISEKHNTINHSCRLICIHFMLLLLISYQTYL